MVALLALTVLLGLASPAKAGTVWLCKPGAKNNPCEASSKSTALLPDKSVRAEKTAGAAKPKVDCFFVYPTVSNQKAGNANLNVDPELKDVARDQASRFSSKCKVYAPVYRQLTKSSSMLGGGSSGIQGDPELAYADVKDAWSEYLKKFNKRRGVILIGHSQGTVNLTRLLGEEIETDKKQRKLLVSALLIGGGVLVPQGKDVGGSFKRTPACRRASQFGCAVAYNSYLTPPAKAARFGVTVKPGMRVLCTNPSNLSGSGPSLPYLPSSRLALALKAQGLPAIETPWVSLPDLYTSECESNQTHSWLQITDVGAADDTRPRFSESLGPNWGLHLLDVSLNLGALVDLVGNQSSAWRRDN